MERRCEKSGKIGILPPYRFWARIPDFHLVDKCNRVNFNGLHASNKYEDSDCD